MTEENKKDIDLDIYKNACAHAFKKTAPIAAEIALLIKKAVQEKDDSKLMGLLAEQFMIDFYHGKGFIIRSIKE